MHEKTETKNLETSIKKNTLPLKHTRNTPQRSSYLCYKMYKSSIAYYSEL